MSDPYFFAPKADLFDPIAALLEATTATKSYLLEQSRNHAVARWDWLPTEGPFSGPSMVGDSPRVLADVEFRCDVACRAKTFDQAWLMAQQFGSALRRIKFAGGKIESWKVTESSDQAATLKTVLVLTVVWIAPFIEQPLGNATTKAIVTSVGFDTTSDDYGEDDNSLIAPSG